MKILGYQPSRRRFFRTLVLAVAGAPLVKLGRVIPRRRRVPKDISAIPWIGHC